MRLFAGLPLSMLLASCAVSPWTPDLAACAGTPSVVNQRYSAYARAISGEVLSNQRYALLFTSCSDAGRSVNEQLAACTRAVESGRLFRQDLALGLECRGSHRIEAGEYDYAIVDYAEAIGVDPWYAAAYSDRGVALLALGDADRAIDSFDAAISIDPLQADAFSNRSAARHMKGDDDRAIADASTAIDFYNKDRAFGWGSNIHGNRIDFSESHYTLRLGTRAAVAYFNRGLAWSGKGQVDRAIADYDMALLVDRQLSVAYRMRSAAWRAKGMEGPAIADLAEARRISAQDSGGRSADRWTVRSDQH